MPDASSSPSGPRSPLLGGPHGIDGPCPLRSEIGLEKFRKSLGLHRDPVAYLGSGREALAWWERHLAPPGTILVPAYGCRSMVQPYLQASRGIRFYPVGQDLQPDKDALRTLRVGAGAIHVVHYFGFPAPDWLYMLGIPVLDDAVQGLLDPQLRSRGRWAIGSFRKFGPTAAGGFLSDRVEIPAPPPPDRHVLDRWSHLDTLRREKWQAAQAGDKARWSRALSKLADDETGMDVGRIRPTALEGDSLTRLQTFDTTGMRGSRREAWLVYQRELEGVPGLRPIHENLPMGVIPYGYAIVLDARDRLKQALFAEGIQTVVHWDVPEEVTASSFPDSHALARRILTLPVDEQTGAEGALRVASTVKRILSRL